MFFQLVTVAPKRRTCTVSPVGRRAETVLLSSEMLTIGCGASLVGLSLSGLLARSIFTAISEDILKGQENLKDFSVLKEMMFVVGYTIVCRRWRS